MRALRINVQVFAAMARVSCIALHGNIWKYKGKFTCMIVCVYTYSTARVLVFVCICVYIFDMAQHTCINVYA